MKKNLWVVVIIIIIVLGLLWLSSAKKDKSNEPITIGFVGSLTGDLQDWGIESKNSIALAVDEINQTGGINGQPLKIIYEDGKCESASATSAAQKLISVDQVKILISYCSLETLTIAPITEKNKILLFAPEATSPNVTGAGDYVFRLAPSDTLPAKQLADLIASKYKKIAIITEVSDFSTAFRDNLLKNLEKTPEVKVVYDELFTGKSRDFRSAISKIKESGPEAVIVNGNSPITNGLLIKQMDELKLSAKRLGAYWGHDPEFLSITKESSEGFLFFNFMVNEDNPKVQKFLDAYKAKYGVLPPNPQFATLSYDAPYILAEAIKNSGTNPDKLKSYLYNLKDFNALSGKISFDQNGDSQGANFTLFEIQNGKPVRVQ